MRHSRPTASVPRSHSHASPFQVELAQDIHPLPDSVTPYVSSSQVSEPSSVPTIVRLAVRLSVRARATHPHPRVITTKHARHLRRTARGPPPVPRRRKGTTTTRSAQTGRPRIRRQKHPARARASRRVRETTVFRATNRRRRPCVGEQRDSERRCHGWSRGRTRKDGDGYDYGYYTLGRRDGFFRLGFGSLLYVCTDAAASSSLILTRRLLGTTMGQLAVDTST